MDKNKIYEVAYKTIRDSLEWGCEKNSFEQFFDYVDGIINVTDELLSEIDKPVGCEENEKN